MRLRKRLIGFIAIIQSVLFLTHFLLYETWTFSPAGSDTPGALWIKLVLGFLSVSFVAASLLAFRCTNAALRASYRAAAVWVGLVTFLFLATVSSWIIFGVAWVVGLDVLARRIYRRFVYGLSRIGKMQVFTSSGAGTWGPPLRLGSNPEIVVLEFE